MNPFDQALSYVQDALAQKRQGASGSRASHASLQRLVEATRGFQPQPMAERTPEPKPEPGSSQGAKGLAARVRAAMGEAPPPNSATSKTPDAPISKSMATASSESSREERMERLRQKVLTCVTCADLAHKHPHVVFGGGDVNAELMFVGEAPGAEEELTGEPFVGKAGQLLTKIIEAMGFRREQVYMANVVKCRPTMPSGESGNREPSPDEIALCLPYLIEQIEIIRPKCIVALGGTAAEGLLNKATPIGELRGHWHSFKGIPLMATYHPAYLLRNQSNTEKRKVWEDMLQVLELLGKPITPKQRGYFLSKG